MYSNTNQNNPQQQAESQVWQTPQMVTIGRWTKPRQNRDGNGVSRGVCLKSSIDGSEKWISLYSNHHVFKMLNWGSQCFYQPTEEPHNRLQIGVAPQQQTNQPQADYYSRQAQPANTQSVYEQIDNSLQNSRPNGYQYDLNNQPEPQQELATINDIEIERLSLIMSNCMLMARELNPNISEDTQSKLAMSVFIAYTKNE